MFIKFQGHNGKMISLDINRLDKLSKRLNTFSRDFSELVGELKAIIQTGEVVEEEEAGS